MTHPFQVSLSIQVKTYDTDYAGVVSNLVYLRWLEDLRLALLDAYFPLQGQLAQGYTPVLRRTEIDYRRPVRLFDPVIGRMWLPKISHMKWYISAEFEVEGSLVATAEQVGAFLDLNTWKPIPVPPDFARGFSSLKSE
ncbi:acyl-CoA thioesterase [Thermostichus vulcanus]|uniref:Acyl-CoA thioesterase n=1 Tax=Thermostichus vulcanus str. 'Rupite' TaxID=2813851 RepID=A0ABT0C8H7_THEVL|nr:thioesterase family protein [Thermostichus vulcanus]MCJ2542059.1 acyl-CoA thioesterase [Thermostichus vulcanus str. 'Rupite']